MSTGNVSGEWAGELAGGFTGLVTMADDIYWSDLNLRLTGIESQLATIDTNSAQTWDSVSDLTFGLSASYNLLNGTIRLDLESTKQSALHTESDTNAIRSDVGAIKTKVNDIYSVLVLLRDDFATFSQRYAADASFMRSKFDDLDEQSTRIITNIGALDSRITTVISDIHGVNNNVGRVQGTVTNIYDALGTQSQEIKQKVDEGKQGVLSSIRDALYAGLRCVCALLEPIYFLCRPSLYNSAVANVSVTTDGAVSVTATTESDMCEWTGTAQNFSVSVRQVEGYLPFKSETGNHEYTYSDELKQVLALPYRR